MCFIKFKSFDQILKFLYVEDVVPNLYVPFRYIPFPMAVFPMENCDWEATLLYFVWNTNITLGLKTLNELILKRLKVLILEVLSRI